MTWYAHLYTLWIEPTARLLATLTAPITRRMQDGETALTCAAEAGHAAIVLMLLETKPGVHDTVSAQFQGPVAIPSDNVTSSQSKNEAMVRAAREGHVAVVQALLDAGVSKDYAVRSTGF
jgi:ankyrin repeat protein